MLSCRISTMVYVDTNVLIYAGLEQDLNKKMIAMNLLENHAQNDTLQLSLLTLQEYSFTLAKLKIDNAITQQDIYYYSNHVKHLITKEIFLSAVELCTTINYYRNINDVIHLKFAEQHCDKLITFDNDFKNLKPYTDMEIEILN